MPDIRATRYTPAVTIVAAWINADTGVGPAIASGSQTCSGICADLPVAPIKSKTPTNVADTAAVGPLMNSALMRSISSVPNAWYNTNIPSRKPASPTRLVMNALVPARALSGSSNQNPINRYDASPTPSQPTNSTNNDRPKHQHQHEKQEQIQIGEVAAVTFVALHVADRIDVDQRADAGDNQRHHRARRSK